MRSSSPGSNITPTSSPGRCSAAEKGAKLRVAPVDNTGQIMLEEYEKLLNPRTRLVSFVACFQRAGHDHSRPGNGRDGPPPRR